MAEVRELTQEGQRGAMYLHSLVDLAAEGFEEREWVVAGEARGATSPGGPVSARPFATRILVRRPVDPARFNGCVIVEWLNVTTGSDVEILWCSVRELLLREGYGWVGLTAQPLGVAAMQRWDPARYGELEHPGMPEGDLPPLVWGETWSYDVFTQVGRLLRGESGAALFGRSPEVLVAHGQSQSSMRLTTYLAEVQPESDVYDGFLLHAGGGNPIVGRPDIPDTSAIPVPAQRARVLKLNSEAEAEAHRQWVQADAEGFAYWEIPGTGHTPVAYLRDTLARTDHSGMQRERFEWANPLGPLTVEFGLRAAIHHLARWVSTGVRPPEARLIEMAGSPAAIARDADGNATGGLRLPHLEVPAGRYLATNDADHRLHPGFVPFGRAEMARRYGDASAYRERVAAAAAASVEEGFVLAGDVDQLVDELAAVGDR